MIQKNKQPELPSYHRVSSIISIERDALETLEQSVPVETDDVIARISACKGRVIFLGMGKSGLAGALLSATFSSIGIPSLSVHPAEALHGDLGMITSNDCCIVISKSASGIELEYILKYLQHKSITSILWSCKKGVLSSLANLAIVLPLNREADSRSMVPSASTLVVLSYGHAVGFTVAEQRGFSKEAFLDRHPAGTVGAILRESLGI